MPGLAGVRLLLEEVSQDSWMSGTIVVGGVDGLSKADYAELCAIPAANVAEQNHPDNVSEFQWVNCSVTIVKGSNGDVQFWVQPKLWPAWEEQNIRNEHMFRGRSIFVFKGRLDNNVYFRFVSVICFDWIATVDHLSPIDWVVENLDAAAGEGQLPLTWALVIQNNPKPSHPAFTSRVSQFFDEHRFPKAIRQHSCLIFCNSAGAKSPGKASHHGSSSLIHSRSWIFQQAKSAPTVCAGGARFRDGSDALAAFSDTCFRERGACVHTFALVNPASLTAGPQGRSYATENAKVFSLGDPCARAPGDIVPASLKWAHDALDEITSIGADFHEAPLSAAANAAHGNSVGFLRSLGGRQICSLMATANNTPKSTGADDWGDGERGALTHVAQSLNILLTAASEVSAHSSDGHAVLTFGGKAIDFIALTGGRHQDCVERAKFMSINEQRAVLVITRDKYNTHHQPYERSFLEEEHAGEARFTFPEDSFRYVGFQNLLDQFRSSADTQELTDSLLGIVQ